MWDRSLVTTDNFSTFFCYCCDPRDNYKTSWSPWIQPRTFISGVSRLHHCCTLPQDDQRNGRLQICVDAKTQKASTTGLRSRISECPRAFAGSAFSECYFLVEIVNFWGSAVSSLSIGKSDSFHRTTSQIFALTNIDR